ncbi:YafY family transcriptional regulator [Luteolibacter yonseiensis]|uniref:YafY family transcriptional regulator n=1 Tax=Luteolibacter yonseiensis TaxID=1144680 RepID=A0A934QZ62_9BACT|nr:YafY family protein [Luteolibacter yonseiensis]MBK1815403.1 YafY family transcriptional regulator [Luteolibacter yonseiensis]
MNRIDRLTGMILLLQGQRVITAEQIAGHFEISVRTVYRDLAALGEAGVPIIAEAGIGYSLMRGYHMPPVMFTEDEAAALFMSGVVTEQIADDSLSQSLKSALLKVRSVLPQEKRDYLHQLKDKVSVSFRQSHDVGKRESLMPIQDAVVRRRCLRIGYNTASQGDITERLVEPLGLVFYARRWHLIAWCRLRKEVRDFRLDRMASWKVMDECFQEHSGFLLKEFLRKSIENHELTPATVIVERGALERFHGEIPCTRISEEIQQDGRVRLELLTYSCEWLGGWLLGFGTRVEAVEPPELRDGIRDAALAVAARHAEEFSVV